MGVNLGPKLLHMPDLLLGMGPRADVFPRRADEVTEVDCGLIPSTLHLVQGQSSPIMKCCPGANPELRVCMPVCVYACYHMCAFTYRHVPTRMFT